MIRSSVGSEAPADSGVGPWGLREAGLQRARHRRGADSADPGVGTGAALPASRALSRYDARTDVSHRIKCRPPPDATGEFTE